MTECRLHEAARYRQINASGGLTAVGERFQHAGLARKDQRMTFPSSAPL